ncbi:MAG TPA: reverse transcriptase/maturase family protein [Candidatus Nanoarchaeia archaeon]|nr:reverse transcriptase/maturase family protein [Candidatus Nanoarchaeia archaeon]
MKTYKHLYPELCSYKNLESAFRKAKKRKSARLYVIEFEKNLKENLFQLQNELQNETYRPQPLKTFILRDPKTRKISVSVFRDRIVHHALGNVLLPIFEKSFIYDSYANRLGKGTLAALDRFDYFKCKVSRNNTKNCFVLKADIKHYFETVNHNILLDLIRRKITDIKIIWLIKKILQNYSGKDSGRGMPLGNYTSQFFANVYLHELDYFIKYQLKAGYYLRYVDDFVILNNSQELLNQYKKKIDIFLHSSLLLELHPEKSRISLLSKGISLLGFRNFYYHRLLLKKNLRQFQSKYALHCQQYQTGEADYDKIYNFLESWTAQVKYANSYSLRKKILISFEEKFFREVSTKEINRQTTCRNCVGL